MAEILTEQYVNDEIAIIVIKKKGEVPFTQVIPSKLRRLEKLQKYVETNHGNKREKYEKMLAQLVEDIQAEASMEGNN